MRILGIETSCDETAAAVVEDGHQLLSSMVASSMDLQAKYGGVVPEIAARSHMEAMMPVVEEALDQANCDWDDIDAIAVTYGAGLGGCLLVGVMTARTLAITKQKQLYGVNHVEAHVYANFITNTTLPNFKLPTKQPDFPILALIVSGNHSQLVVFRDHFDYTLLGQTHDDAIGEAFDKVAKVLGLPYPGGPSIGALAKTGNPQAYSFPKAQMTSVSPTLEELRLKINDKRLTKKNPPRQSSIVNRQSTKSYDFSFSGVKTAVLRTIQAECGKSHDFPSFKLAALLSEPQKADFAASFQRIAVETVVDKTIQAYEEFQPKSVIIAGGVASSPELRRQLAERLPIPINYTDPQLCTDNGAMVATLACFKMQHDQPTTDPYSLEIAPNLSM